MSKLITVIVIILVILGLWLGLRSDNKKGMDASESASTTEMDQSQKMAPLTDGTYTLDTSASVINWEGSKKLVNTTHKGTLALKDGNFVVTNGAIASGTFTVDMTSLKDDGTGVGKHLLSADFFDVATYPTAMFTLTSVMDGMVTGDLMIKGITQSVTFPVSLAQDADTITAMGSVALDRTLWNVRFGSDKFFDNLGDNVVKDEMKISLSLVAKKN